MEDIEVAEDIGKKELPKGLTVIYSAEEEESVFISNKGVPALDAFFEYVAGEKETGGRLEGDWRETGVMISFSQGFF